AGGGVGDAVQRAAHSTRGGGGAGLRGDRTAHDYGGAACDAAAGSAGETRAGLAMPWGEGPAGGEGEDHAGGVEAAGGVGSEGRRGTQGATAASWAAADEAVDRIAGRGKAKEIKEQKTSHRWGTDLHR